MKAEWLRQIRTLAAEPERLMAEPQLISLLYHWQRYAGSPDEPRAWVTAAIQSDAGFVVLVDRMMSRGTSHSIGDRVATPYNTFNRETIEAFIDIETAKARCDRIDPEAFPNEKDALQTLRRHIKDWLGPRQNDG